MHWLNHCWLLVFLLAFRDSSGASPLPGAEPHHVLWEGVTLEVSSNKPSDGSGRRTAILQGVSGHALPGRLLAIMGPSGCGKSSLLNVLAGRVPAARQKRLEGTVEVGKTPLDDFDTQRYVAYVRQEQDFYPFLTVRETLLLKAGLRLDRTVTHAQKEEIVSATMDKLGLSRSAETLVGDLKTPGISGGEKRRLAMGLQMIGLEAPSVILLDEPTSGLDSHQALQVMATVRDLCLEGHTVIVAIHQPRSSIYALFDDLLLLSDGRVMYHGSMNDVLPRLASLGHKCPSNFNPADFMVDLISAADCDNRGEMQAKVEVLSKLAEAAKKDWETNSALRLRDSNGGERRRWWEGGTGDDSDERESEDVPQSEGAPRSVGVRREEGRGKLAVVPASSLTVSKPRGGRRRTRRRKRRRRAVSGWGTQFGLLLRRSWKQATRDKFAAVARVAMGFGLGGMFGSIFWKLGLSESSISGRISLYVNVAMNVAMLGCTRALQTLAVETRVVNLERMDEGYSASAYLSSKILAEMPTDTVFPLIFGTVVYFMAGLNSPLGGGLKLTRYLATLLLQAHASSAVGLMVGCLSPSMEAANLLGPAVMIISLMLSGVHDNIPPYLAKLKTFSTVNWGVQGIVTNEMTGIKFIPDGKVLLNGWKLGTKKQVIPGEDVMGKMGFEGEGLGKPLKRLVQLSFGCHFVTLATLMASVPRFQRLEADCSESSPPRSTSSSRNNRNAGTLAATSDGAEER